MEPQVRSLLRMGFRAIMFLAAAVGISWYYYASGSAHSFSPMDLGLVHLFLMVFAIFLGICIGRGFTVSRILLLVIPFLICSYLTQKLIVLHVAQGSPANYHGLRLLLLGAVLYLYIVLSWVAVFPVPFSWPKAPPQLVAMRRRLEWVAVALLAGVIAVFAWYMMSSAEMVQPSEDLTAEIREYAGRKIQGYVLAIFLLVIFKVALRFELAEKYGTNTQPTQT